MIATARLAEDAPPALLAALDAILTGAREALVHPGQHLEGARERSLDAAGDPDRVVLWAAVEGRPAGIADAVLQLGTLTVAVLATAPWARRRGVGRALVRAALEALGTDALELAAGVHPRSADARAFWASLGLSEEPGGARAGVLMLRAPITDRIFIGKQ